MPLNKSWHDYNGSLIEPGRVSIVVTFLKSSNEIADEKGLEITIENLKRSFT